ncbi:MAG: alpha-L-fucosidase [Paramuribaculum sp.]|nr:alpha-L-fucosidase [Paramuribaculum sp.]MDE7151853.1 alpha-L-fucosidase [Candidatus Amulumruptor sp.]
MKLTKRLLWAAAAAACALPAAAQSPEPDSLKTERMEWFSDAKLGIFIHWGIYSKGETSESWAFHNGHISLPDYMAQSDYFTADKYNPQEWVDLIKESGAKYTVITTKHHDGFALWDTKAGKVSAVKSSPAKRDVLAPFAEAVKDAGLKLGFYYSLIDWPDPDYPETYRDKAPKYDIKKEPKRWQKFLDFNNAQLTELSSTWNPDLYWFDGDWEHSAEEWNAPGVIKLLRSYNPDVIVNSRIQGYGDYATPELGVPVKRPSSPWWETCMTINDSWGFRTNDDNYKTPNTVLHMLVDCIGMGGNLLLDIGPRADGSIPEEEVAMLKAVGRWVNKHAEAVYGTRAGLPKGHIQANTSISKDGKTIYVYMPYRPTGGVELKGLKSRVKSARIVGNDTPVDWKIYNDISWSASPGVYYFSIPEEALDPEITVMALELDSPVTLYEGEGQVISFNDNELN